MNLRKIVFKMFITHTLVNIKQHETLILLHRNIFKAGTEDEAMARVTSVPKGTVRGASH